MQTKKPLLLDLYIPYGNGSVKYIAGEQLYGSNEEKNAYLEALIKEVLSYEGQLDDYEIRAVRLSGGAATVMKPDLLGKLLSTVRKVLPVARGAEVSFDALPGTICTPSLTGIAAGRPNRAELFMRSYVEDDLRALGCPFTLQDIKNSLLYFGRFHMNNLGFTINYGFPGHTMKNWEFTLISCANMRPAHISIEPVIAENSAAEEDRLQMFETAVRILSENGYLHYGKGLFCLPEHEYIYEALLGNGCEYIGMGLNAVSCFDGVVTRNTNNLRLYMLSSAVPERLVAQAEALSDEALQQNYVFSRLSMCSGLETAQFEKRFNASFSADIEAKLDKLISNGALSKQGDAYIPANKYLMSI